MPTGMTLVIPLWLDRSRLRCGEGLMQEWWVNVGLGICCRVNHSTWVFCSLQEHSQPVRLMSHPCSSGWPVDRSNCRGKGS